MLISKIKCNDCHRWESTISTDDQKYKCFKKLNAKTYRCRRCGKIVKEETNA